MGKTLYAVIQPPASFDGSIIDAFAYPLVTAYHKLAYSTLNGYSPGNKIYFFDSLDEAKDRVFPPSGIRGKVEGLYQIGSQNAVIELDTEDGIIINVKRIHEIKAFQPAEFRGERVTQAVWRDMEIQDKTNEDFLKVINDQLQLRYYHPHYKDSKHPKAKLCRELSEKFNKEKGPTTTTEEQRQIDLLSQYSFGSMLVALGIAIANPESILDFVPQLIAFSSILAGTSAYIFTSNIEEKQKEKEAYIKNGLFASKIKEYTGPMTRSRKKAEEAMPEPPRLGYR